MAVSINGTTGLTGVAAIDDVSSTELGYLDGVTSAVQGQLDGKQAAASTGLVLITTQSFSAVSSVSINNCFSADYDNYRILWDAVNPSGAYDVSVRLRSGGSDNTSAIYGRQSIYFYATTVGTDYNDNQRAWVSTSPHDTSGGAAVIDIFNPAASSATRMNVVGGRAGSGKVGFFLAASFAADGFTFYPTSGSLTGSVYVYGYRNS
jgi:hypothetical protein